MKTLFWLATLATSPTGGQCLRRNTTGHRWTSSSMSVRTIAVNQCWVDSLGRLMSKRNSRLWSSFPIIWREKINLYPGGVLLSVCVYVFYVWFSSQPDMTFTACLRERVHVGSSLWQPRWKNAQLLERELSYDAMSVWGDAAFQVVSFIVTILWICFMYSCSPMLNTASLF